MMIWDSAPGVRLPVFIPWFNYLLIPEIFGNDLLSSSLSFLTRKVRKKKKKERLPHRVVVKISKIIHVKFLDQCMALNLS